MADEPLHLVADHGEWLEMAAGTSRYNVPGTLLDETVEPPIEPPIEPPVEPPITDYFIAADQWTAEPDPERGTGHREINVSSDVTPVPAGYSLKIWTWRNPGVPAASTATITPGIPYYSVTPLRDGDTCYNSLWLYQESDGYNLQVSDEKTFPIEGPAAVVPPPSSAVDATVATAAAARSQLQAWIAAGLSGPRTLGITASITGTLDLSGLVSPTHPITIRPIGEFTAANLLEPDCSVKISGGVNLANARNIRLLLFRVDNIGQNGINTSGSTDVTIERCYLRGRLGSNGIPTSNNLMDTANTRGLSILDCVIKNSINAHLYFHGGPHAGTRIEGCVLENAGHDDLKCANLMTDLAFINNWFGRAKLGNIAAVHDDCFQVQAGGWEGAHVRGNVQWRTPSLWTGGVAGTQQGFWLCNTTARIPARNCLFEQNIMMTDNCGIKGSDLDTTGTQHRYNLLYTMPNGNSATNYIGMGGAADYNVIVSTNGNGAGPNGLHINTRTAGTPNYTDSDAHFVNGGPRDAATSYVDKLLAKPGSRLHWNSAQKTGAFLRIREIVDATYRAGLPGPVIPADIGWPTGPVWTGRFNDNGGVATGHTGKFDADGNNT